jgi:endoglucanase
MIAALVLLAVVGAAPGAQRPFGSHGFAYPRGALRPSAPQVELDATTARVYDAWKAAYLKGDCGDDTFYVQATGGAGTNGETFTVSEAHGYGMVITAMMAGHDPEAQRLFDGLHRFWRKYPSINARDLPGWEVMRRQGRCVGGTDAATAESATDGDLDVAFALLVAHAQWGNDGAVRYLEEARKVIAAILAHDISPTSRLTLLGDWADTQADYYRARYRNSVGPYGVPGTHAHYRWGTRPSDHMMDHFRAFRVASGDETWGAVINAHYQLIALLQRQYGKGTGLLPDFVVAATPARAKPARPNYLERDSDGEYKFNSCRVPWRIGTDYVVSGDPRARRALAPLNAWIVGRTGGDPAKIVDGYRLDGSATGQKSQMSFTAPFGVAALAGDDQTWLDRLWRHIAQSPSDGERNDSIKLLAMIVMSGNWFPP